MLLGSMRPELAAIFQNEFEHHEAKKNNEEKDSDKEVKPFAYVRLGGVDMVLKGYGHDEFWQEEHGEYLAKTAENAKILCIEGGVDIKFGDSLESYWKGNYGDYDILIREVAGQGFKGIFAEIDMRDQSKIELDNTKGLFYHRLFPNLPEEFFKKYLGYTKIK